MGTKCFSCPSKFTHLLPATQEAPRGSCRQIFIGPVEVTWLDAASTFLRSVGPDELQRKKKKPRLWAERLNAGLCRHRAIEGHQTSLWHHEEILSKNCLFLYEVKQESKVK